MSIDIYNHLLSNIEIGEKEYHKALFDILMDSDYLNDSDCSVYFYDFGKFEGAFYSKNIDKLFPTHDENYFIPDDEFASKVVNYDPEIFQEIIQKQKNGEKTCVTYTVVGKNEEKRSIYDLSYPIRDHDGRVLGVVGVISEVPNDKTMSTNDWHSIILDSLDQAVVVTDLNGTIIFWNRFAEKIYERRSQEVVGKKLRDVVFTHQSEQETQLSTGWLHFGKAWSEEVQVTKSSGESLIVEVTKIPHFDRNGNLIAFIEVSKDVSKRKEKFRTAFFYADMMKNLHIPMLATDNALVITEWNLALQDLLGWRAFEVINESIASLWKNKTLLKQCKAALMEMNPNKVYTDKVSLQNRFGDLINLTLRISRIVDHQGVASGLLLSLLP